MPGAAVLLWQPSISVAGRIMIQYIRIQKFRSVKDIALELGPLNIVFGPNGCGKSNIYNAIHLLTAAAEGRLSGFISEEGGLENMMWSGERSPSIVTPAGCKSPAGPTASIMSCR